MSAAFVHGFILALGLILPLGVQNVFVFNQGAVQPSFFKALPAIITASVCDTVLISLAVFGVSVVVLEFFWLKAVFMLVGIGFLIYMGIVTWRSKPTVESEDGLFTAKKQIIFAVSVSLLNPHAILDTIGVIGTSSLNYTGAGKAAFSIACILVSWVWFTGLAIIGRGIGRLDQSGRFLTLLNKVSAVIMWGVAVYIVQSLV
ncbi:LysE/ArgO family amino acid transporter [Heyndrickxia acidiproducens]|uniref:LysE/ArgO family amino acid transporter n=1 Tax=Heyndrickxia acidiproducens TaxID=1121084 RepID=UPI00035EF2D4|nr:LysE/ArgO family amino acid transporter [Heyndrickxia acidiproducens]